MKWEGVNYNEVWEVSNKLPPSQTNMLNRLYIMTGISILGEFILSLKQ